MKKRILVVEDEKMILSVLTKKLEDSGYDVSFSRDGKEALDMALKENYDLILLDIILPKMDGITLLEKYNEEKKENKAPVIMLSNLDNADKIEESKNRGAYDYLVKTDWSLDDVVQKIKATIGM